VVLPAPVGPDQGKGLAALDLEGDAVKDDVRAVGFPEILDNNQRHVPLPARILPRSFAKGYKLNSGDVRERAFAFGLAGGRPKDRRYA
jgi:hypothetical protein